MISKSIVILAVLVFGIQVLNAKSIKAEVRLLPELIQQAKDIINNLVDWVNDTLQDALNTLRGLIDPVYVMQQKYLKQGTEKVAAFILRVTDLIDDVVEEADKEGLNITHCIEGRGEQLEELSVTLTENVSVCVNTAADKPLQFIDAKVELFTQIGKDILGLPLRLAKCTVTWKPITCVSELTKEMVSLYLSVPVELIHAVDEANKLVTGLPTEMRSCVAVVTQEADEKTDVIRDEISICTALAS